jgi:hypothetical protein
VPRSVPAPQKSPYRAATPVIAGLVGGAFAMSAAFAMTTATRPALHDRAVAASSPAKPAAAVAAHLAPASRDPALKMLAFNAPVAGFQINSPFGMRRMPWEEGGRLHEGVDIAAPSGTPVAATLAGTVTRTGLSASYGRFIEVRHDGGLVSFYAHLGRAGAGLKGGSPILSGQTVGYVGGTGRSTGSHLHFEIRRDGRPLNPALFIGQTFASLDQLPLKDAAKVSRRVRIAVVSSWPASVRAAAVNRAGGVVQLASNDTAGDGRVRAVIAPRGPMEIVARDPKKAAEARARLRAMEAAEASAGPEAAQPVSKSAQGGTQVPLSRVKVQPLTVPSA